MPNYSHFAAIYDTTLIREEYKKVVADPVKIEFFKGGGRFTAHIAPNRVGEALINTFSGTIKSGHPSCRPIEPKTEASSNAEHVMCILTVFDRLRAKRNLALYDDTGFISRHDAGKRSKLQETT